MTTDPEQFNTHRYKDTEWISPEDEVIINGIDTTMDDYAEVDERLEKVYKSVPTFENPMKIVRNLELQYNSLAEDDRSDFLLELERRIFIEDESEIQKNAIKYFLNLCKEGSENG